MIAAGSGGLNVEGDAIIVDGAGKLPPCLVSAHIHDLAVKARLQGPRRLDQTLLLRGLAGRLRGWRAAVEGTAPEDEFDIDRHLEKYARFHEYFVGLAGSAALVDLHRRVNTAAMIMSIQPPSQTAKTPYQWCGMYFGVVRSK